MLDKYTCDKCGHLFDTPQHQLGCVDACGIRDDFEYYKWLDEEVVKEQEDWYSVDIGVKDDDSI